MKHLSTLLIFAILTICSCTKESSNDPIVTTNDSITLIKYVDLDTTQIVGLDTLVVNKITYDNSKRLKESNTTEYSSGIPNKLFQNILFYNGVDTLPFKKTQTISDLPSGTVTGTSIGYYNYSNNKLVSDSAIYYYNTTTYYSRHYSYESDKIIETTYIYYSSVPTITTRSIYLTKNNGNTILQKDTVIGFYTHNFSFQYDNKNNPFYGRPQAFVDRSLPYYDMETFSEEMAYEKNNPTEINEFENSYNFHFKYLYEYKPNGYPSVARVYDQNDPLNFFKRIFIYTKL